MMSRPVVVLSSSLFDHHLDALEIDRFYSASSQSFVSSTP